MSRASPYLSEESLCPVRTTQQRDPLLQFHSWKNTSLLNGLQLINSLLNPPSQHRLPLGTHCPRPLLLRFTAY